MGNVPKISEYVLFCSFVREEHFPEMLLFLEKEDVLEILREEQLSCSKMFLFYCDQ